MHSIDGAWLNQEPYFAFHRVCVEESMKGRGLAARLFSEAEQYVLKTGVRNIRIDTHPDNQAMQRARQKAATSAAARLSSQGKRSSAI
ncbi:MAG: GNAT family N-acetyltransferase [Enterocloster clostridioformis]